MWYKQFISIHTYRLTAWQISSVAPLFSYPLTWVQPHKKGLIDQLINSINNYWTSPLHQAWWSAMEMQWWAGRGWSPCPNPQQGWTLLVTIMKQIGHEGEEHNSMKGCNKDTLPRGWIWRKWWCPEEVTHDLKSEGLVWANLVNKLGMEDGESVEYTKWVHSLCKSSVVG